MKGVSTHEGEFICRLAANRDVDFIYLGRRGLNKCALWLTLFFYLPDDNSYFSFSRFFMGSTSKYVMENSESNVCIVKAPASGKEEPPAPPKAERQYSGETIDIKHP